MVKVRKKWNERKEKTKRNDIVPSIGFPVRGDLCPLTISTQAGMRIEVAMSPVCPPPSPPCAQMRSTPT